LTKVKRINELYESMLVLRFFVDDVIFKRVDRTFVSECNKLITEFNQDYFKDNVDFSTRETIQRLHKFISKCKSLFQKNYVDELETFYIDTIESLCFEKGKKRLEDSAIEEILKSITNTSLG
jgi:hypothetical protein